jgi:S-adenosylmethionine hydrolase
MPSRIVTLTTDFGLADHFVGVMKGVILRICPSARIADITHQVTPFEVTEAAFLLSESYRWFPPRTVHVVVVDPGVGTSRRPIVAEAAGQYFIAPDNGVLSMIFTREKHKVRAITAEKYFLQPVSNTFHGRDIFAPAAAHVASGVLPSRLGKPIDDYMRLQQFDKPARTARRGWTGAVLKVDRFGNLITNFHTADFPDLHGRAFEIAVGPRKVDKTARNYAECAPGELFLIVGSSGYYEVSSSQASAAKLLGCGTGAPVELTIF